MTLTLDAPAEAEPGSELELKGSLTLEFDESIRSGSLRHGTTARFVGALPLAVETSAEKTSKSIAISTGEADLWTTGPITYTVGVTVPAVSVPNEEGQLTFAMSNRFGGDLLIEAPSGTTARRKLGCDVTDPPTVATVPVSAPPASGSSTTSDGPGDGSGTGPGGSGPGGSGAGGSGSDSDRSDGTGPRVIPGATGSPGLRFPAPSAGASPRAPGASSSASPRPDASEDLRKSPQASGDTAYVDLPPKTRSGMELSDWRVALAVALVLVVGAGLVAWTRIRLIVLRRRADGPP